MASAALLRGSESLLKVGTEILIGSVALVAVSAGKAAPIAGVTGFVGAAIDVVGVAGLGLYGLEDLYDRAEAKAKKLWDAPPSNALVLPRK